MKHIKPIIGFTLLFLLACLFWWSIAVKPNEPAIQQQIEKIPNMIIEDWDGEKG